MQSRGVCFGVAVELDAFIYSIVNPIITEQNPVLGIVGDMRSLRCGPWLCTSPQMPPNNFRNHACLTFWLKQILKPCGKTQLASTVETSTADDDASSRLNAALFFQYQMDRRTSVRGRVSAVFTSPNGKRTTWQRGGCFLPLHPASEGLILLSSLGKLECYLQCAGRSV